MQLLQCLCCLAYLILGLGNANPTADGPEFHFSPPFEGSPEHSHSPLTVQKWIQHHWVAVGPWCWAERSTGRARSLLLAPQSGVALGDFSSGAFGKVILETSLQASEGEKNKSQFMKK